MPQIWLLGSSILKQKGYKGYSRQVVQEKMFVNYLHLHRYYIDIFNVVF